MDSKHFMQLLRMLDACSAAREWAKSKSLAEAWNTCPRADWLLWLAGGMCGKQGWPDRKQIVLAACACAETALKFVKPGELRPKECIETVRAWARGSANIEDVRRARAAAAAAASSSSASSSAAAYAAYAAAAAAAAAASSSYDSSYACSYASYATAAASSYDSSYACSYASYASAAAVRAGALAACADIVRQQLKPAILEAAEEEKAEATV